MSLVLFFFFKQKTAYEMRISDWSSDVCSSDLRDRPAARRDRGDEDGKYPARAEGGRGEERVRRAGRKPAGRRDHPGTGIVRAIWAKSGDHVPRLRLAAGISLSACI